ncbi:Hypothetical predicted protein [Paramuricea clavata]|uniref:Uncharacterized protein n=1 Tax=Paramuricea clavata TaxID=317549 RepID=A0A6S7JUH5_PARCT|nr:Hypothetical predicted protein [Paramuricea clavata]
MASGQNEQHVRNCRRRSRKEEKLARRLKHLHHAYVDWSQRRVAKVADVLRMDFMSSEESEVEEETLKVKRYNVRRFAWESRELRRLKKKLDQRHQDSLPGLSKRVFIPREQGELSNKPKPANCPDWACVVENAPTNAQDETPDDLDVTADLNVSR